MAVAVGAGLSGGTWLYALGGAAVLVAVPAFGAVVQKASKIASLTSKTHTRYVPNQSTKSYTVYTLSNPATNKVVYVGRTSNYTARMRAHALNPARRGLVATIKHENLTYLQARAAEQAYIVFYETLDKKDKAKNQINGVNPYRRDFGTIMQNGFGISEALDSIITNEFLSIFE